MWLKPKGLEVCSYVENYTEFKDQTIIKPNFSLDTIKALLPMVRDAKYLICIFMNTCINGNLKNEGKS